MRKNKKSSLWKKVDYDVRKLNGKILFEEIKNGDSTANKVFDKYCEYYTHFFVLWQCKRGKLKLG